MFFKVKTLNHLPPFFKHPSTHLNFDNLHLSYLNYTEQILPILYPKDFNMGGYDWSYTFGNADIRIPRVRFKPGYQRIWRTARTALKDSLGLKFTFQKKLTSFLTRFHKRATHFLISYGETSLIKIAPHTHLVPDL